MVGHRIICSFALFAIAILFVGGRASADSHLAKIIRMPVAMPVSNMDRSSFYWISDSILVATMGTGNRNISVAEEFERNPVILWDTKTQKVERIGSGIVTCASIRSNLATIRGSLDRSLIESSGLFKQIAANSTRKYGAAFLFSAEPGATSEWRPWLRNTFSCRPSDPSKKPLILNGATLFDGDGDLLVGNNYDDDIRVLANGREVVVENRRASIQLQTISFHEYRNSYFFHAISGFTGRGPLDSQGTGSANGLWKKTNCLRAYWYALDGATEKVCVPYAERGQTIAAYRSGYVVFPGPSLDTENMPHAIAIFDAMGKLRTTVVGSKDIISRAKTSPDGCQIAFYLLLNRYDIATVEPGRPRNELVVLRLC